VVEFEDVELRAAVPPALLPPDEGQGLVKRVLRLPAGGTLTGQPANFTLTGPRSEWSGARARGAWRVAGFSCLACARRRKPCVGT
jgi:hypothetical protein